MIKKQVEVIIFVPNLHPLLPFEECEADAEFEDECFHLAQNGGFDVLFRVGVFELKEVEKVRIAKNQVRCEFVLLAECFERSISPSLTGFRESAVRSNNIAPILLPRVRVFQRSMRHISA